MSKLIPNEGKLADLYSEEFKKELDKLSKDPNSTVIFFHREATTGTFTVVTSPMKSPEQHRSLTNLLIDTVLTYPSFAGTLFNAVAILIHTATQNQRYQTELKRMVESTMPHIMRAAEKIKEYLNSKNN